MNILFILLIAMCAAGCFFLASIMAVLDVLRRGKALRLSDQLMVFISGILALVSVGAFGIGILVALSSK